MCMYHWTIIVHIRVFRKCKTLKKILPFTNNQRFTWRWRCWAIKSSWHNTSFGIIFLWTSSVQPIRGCNRGFVHGMMMLVLVFFKITIDIVNDLVIDIATDITTDIAIINISVAGGVAGMTWSTVIVPDCSVMVFRVFVIVWTFITPSWFTVW